MPRAYDSRPIAVDRNPLMQMDFGVPRLPPLNVEYLWQNFTVGFKELFGLDLSSPMAFVRSILDALQALFNPTNIITAITGVVGGTINTLENFFGGFVAGAGSLIQQVGNALGNLNDVVQGVIGNVGDGVSRFVEWLLGLLGFGGAHAALSGVGTGQLADVNPELLINGSFDGPTSMPNLGEGGWTWDSTVDHKDKTDSGSAKCVANGTPRVLLSNAIEVFKSNVITASAWVKWSDKSGAGGATLALYIYDENDTVIDTAVFESSSTGSSNGWVKLNGSYTVPALLAGVTPTRASLGLVVPESVTAGTFWWDDASLRKINPISHQLVDGFQGAIETVTDKAGATLTDFVHALQSFDRINTGTILDNFVPGIGYLIENGVRGLLGLPPKTSADDVFTHEDFLNAAVTQAGSATGNANSITAIWRYLNAGIYDEFERSGSSLGSNWSTQWGSGNGVLMCEGHNAALPFAWPGGSAEHYSRWVGNNANSVTDYQEVSIVLSSAPGKAFTYSGYNDVIARVSGSSDYVRFRVGGDGAWAMHKFVNGTKYDMYDADTFMPQRADPGSITRPGPGAIITLYAGNRETSEPRRFKAMINNTVICDFVEKTNDGNPASVYDSLHRGRGFGLRAEGVPFLTFGWVGPGMVNYWSGSDQPAPA